MTKMLPLSQSITSYQRRETNLLWTVSPSMAELPCTKPASNTIRLSSACCWTMELGLMPRMTRLVCVNIMNRRQSLNAAFKLKLLLSFYRTKHPCSTYFMASLAPEDAWSTVCDCCWRYRTTLIQQESKYIFQSTLGYQWYTSFVKKKASDVRLNIRDSYSLTPIHLATLEGDVRAVSILVDAGADFRIPDRSKRWPIHYAARDQQLGILGR